MSEAAALKAYRANLLAAGRLLEARAVAHCIRLLQASKPARQIGVGCAIATPLATTAQGDTSSAL